VFDETSTKEARPTQSRGYFAEWLAMLDPDLRRALVEPKSWWTLAAFVAIILTIAAFVPGVKGFFQLDAPLAAACFLPTLGLGLTLGTLQARGRVSLEAFGVLALVGSAIFQWFAWSLVTLAKLPGATVMAGLPILLAAYHGHAFRCGPRYPFVSIGTVLGALAAWQFAEPSQHLGIMATAPLIAIAASLTLGNNAMASARSATERAALREAVNAQLLSERSNQAEHLARSLFSFRSSNHDAGSALSGALFNMELLARKLEPLSTGEHGEELVALTTDVVASLSQLHRLIDDARKQHQPGAQAEYADIAETAERIRREVAARFPDVTITSQLQLAPSRPRFVGGAMVVERIARNLLTNASEGRGGKRASHVQLTCNWDGKALTLEVKDDGPGFDSTQLVQRVAQLQTTKAWGTGLGLYTVEKLCGAQGGSLSLRNTAEGGGVAAVVLPSREG
jgi:signal transduction histidine kinase